MIRFKEEILSKDESKEKEEKKALIMIVDDEPAILKELGALLSSNYDVITASDGQEALEIIQGMTHPEELALIICDQRMPRMTGVELCKKLATNQIMPDTIRIILTAYPDIPVILEAINEAHIYKFILKPFDPNDLILTVQRAIEAFYYQRELKEIREELANRLFEIKEKDSIIAELKKSQPSA